MSAAINGFSGISSFQTPGYSKPKNLASSVRTKSKSVTNVEAMEHLNRAKNAGPVDRLTTEKLLNMDLFKFNDFVKVDLNSEGIEEYWTEERMNKATPRPMNISGNPTDVDTANKDGIDTVV